MEVGVHTLPHFPKDTTDRNRTSPFAFTGNKFEFRMLGSSLNISGPNIVLNTIVAEELNQFADILEKSNNFTADLNKLVKKVIHEHKRIIFNGDGYSAMWPIEAEKRGLLNLKSTVDALPHFIDPKNIDLFTKHQVFTEVEMKSRCEILLDTYSKVVNIEAQTLVSMIKKYVIPGCSKYVTKLTNAVSAKKSLNSDLDYSMELGLATKLSGLSAKLYQSLQELEERLSSAHKSSALNTAKYYREVILTDMEYLRSIIDEIEANMSKEDWPIPTYGDLEFYNE